MDIKFRVEENNYSSASLPAMIQFHIVRRMAPIIGNLVILRNNLLRPEDILVPLVEGLSKLSDADSEYILFHCLEVTQRETTGGGWGPVFNMISKRMMYEDITMITMLNIAYNVLEANLGDFIPSLPPPSTEVTP